jgi:hypothetical protein
MIHLIWACVAGALLFALYKYKQWEIDSLKEIIERGQAYLKQKSDYYTEKDLDLKGKLKICAVSPNITKNNPLILKFLESDGIERIEIIDGQQICYYSGSIISKVISINKHPFRFASDFEAGMESQEPTIYRISREGEQIPMEVAGWEPHWILVFDK